MCCWSRAPSSSGKCWFRSFWILRVIWYQVDERVRCVITAIHLKVFDSLIWIALAEIKHGRIAMLAVVGTLVQVIFPSRHLECIINCLYIFQQYVHLPSPDGIYDSSNPIDAFFKVGPSPIAQAWKLQSISQQNSSSSLFLRFSSALVPLSPTFTRESLAWLTCMLMELSLETSDGAPTNSKESLPHKLRKLSLRKSRMAVLPCSVSEAHCMY